MILKKGYSLLILLTFLFVTNKCLSQAKVEKLLIDSTVVNLNKIIAGGEIGVELEKKINNNSTISFFAGVLPGISKPFGNSTLYYFKDKIIFPFATYIEYKNYYNLKKRLRLKKKIYHNSGNYFTFKAELSFPLKNKIYYNIYTYQGIGLTRNLSKKFNLDGSLGIVEHFALNDNQKNIMYKPNFQFKPYVKIALAYLF